MPEHDETTAAEYVEDDYTELVLSEDGTHFRLRKTDRWKVENKNKVVEPDTK